ncbi:hypothetical protein [Streptomyces formicae]
METQPSPREQALRLARQYAREAATIAITAQDKNRYSDGKPQVANLTAIGALYADVSRTYAAIAQAEPVDIDEEK